SVASAHQRGWSNLPDPAQEGAAARRQSVRPPLHRTTVQTAKQVSGHTLRQLHGRGGRAIVSVAGFGSRVSRLGSGVPIGTLLSLAGALGVGAVLLHALAGPSTGGSRPVVSEQLHAAPAIRKGVAHRDLQSVFVRSDTLRIYIVGSDEDAA